GKNLRKTVRMIRHRVCAAHGAWVYATENHGLRAAEGLACRIYSSNRNVMNASLLQIAASGSAPAVDVGDAGYLKRINAARVYDVAIETPLMHAIQVSKRIGNSIFLKREDLQPVHSFKLRGAYNRIAHLNGEERSRGVICASAGNHAQGVALAGRKLGIRAVIVMPRTT